MIAFGSNGDARKSLTLLESIVYASRKENNIIVVEDETINDMIGNVGVYGDKKGSNFYNLLSSLQKSIRGAM